MRSMKLTAVVVAVPSYGFSSLVSLEINHVPSTNSFTFSDLRTIFSTSPNLSSVTLFAVAIPKVLHLHSVSAIVAPALTDLHLMWSVDASVALFVSCYLPKTWFHADVAYFSTDCPLHPLMHADFYFCSTLVHL
ncbi:hypothetical protein C8R43DRAFT_1130106 [Mycena crocata]|nr:hypothetical protein C8R43DRAFT_1130106 [Mycena crocata]